MTHTAFCSSSSVALPDSHHFATSNILKGFLRNMAYHPPNISSVNKRLEDEMRKEMDSRNIRCPQLERTLHLAASLIELAYYERTFAEKKTIALYNWFLIYVDDMSSRNVGPFIAFQQRYLGGLPQLDPVLTALTDVLRNICHQYDALPANTILSATFEFINSTCIEPEVETLPLIKGAIRFPWFLRDRTGVAVAFALLLFPKTNRLVVRDYIRALPDMNFWISGTNDLLSFHKEEIAGEMATYIHNRAFVEEKSPLETLAALGDDLTASRNTIYEAIGHIPHAVNTWLIWERGYVVWHLTQKRYKLNELGL